MVTSLDSVFVLEKNYIHVALERVTVYRPINAASRSRQLVHNVMNLTATFGPFLCYLVPGSVSKVFVQNLSMKI